MLKQSLGTRAVGGEHSALPEHSNACERCGAHVDMTKTVRLKGVRVVGCPSCNWGFPPVSSR